MNRMKIKWRSAVAAVCRFSMVCPKHSKLLLNPVFQTPSSVSAAALPVRALAAAACHTIHFFLQNIRAKLFSCINVGRKKAGRAAFNLRKSPIFLHPATAGVCSVFPCSTVAWPLYPRGSLFPYHISLLSSSA